MILALSQIIATVSIILLLIFSSIALSVKRSKTKSFIFLSAFLFSNALYIVEFLVLTIPITLNIKLYWLVGFGFSFGFLFGPLLYFYTRSITANEENFSLRNAWHFIPFIIYFLTYISGIRFTWQLEDGVLNFQIIPYMIASLVLIINYKKEIGNYFSSLEKLNLNWMMYVAGGFLLMWLIDLTSYTINMIDPAYVNTSLYLAFVSLLINFIFAILLFYNAIQHPQFLIGKLEDVKNAKYESSILSLELKKEYLNRVINYFESEKAFLNPTLSIQDVANETGINIKYISQVINESLDKNFHDFVNSYRVKEAINHLMKNEVKDKTILEILYESGFNSKTTFNTAFKKHTGFTPTEFRHQNINA